MSAVFIPTFYHIEIVWQSSAFASKEMNSLYPVSPSSPCWFGVCSLCQCQVALPEADRGPFRTARSCVAGPFLGPLLPLHPCSRSCSLRACFQYLVMLFQNAIFICIYFHIFYF